MDEHEIKSFMMKPIDWAITIFVINLPLIGLIMLFVWAFSNDGNLVRQNFAKGYLLFMLLALVIAFFILLSFGGMIFSNLDQFRNV